MFKQSAVICKLPFFLWQFWANNAYTPVRSGLFFVGSNSPIWEGWILTCLPILTTPLSCSCSSWGQFFGAWCITYIPFLLFLITELCFRYTALSMNSLAFQCHRVSNKYLIFECDNIYNSDYWIWCTNLHFNFKSSLFLSLGCLVNKGLHSLIVEPTVRS